MYNGFLLCILCVDVIEKNKLRIFSGCNSEDFKTLEEKRQLSKKRQGN
jgi:hypothetical protein